MLKLRWICLLATACFMLACLLLACSNDTNDVDAGLEDAGLEDAGLEDAGLDDAGGEDAGGDEAPACGTDRVREDLSIPTLDGYFLSAFVDRPAQADCPLPTILLQTPYNKESAWGIFFGEERPERPLFASPHYNYVVADWRGSYGSRDLPHPGDGPWMAQDSYDTVEWIAAQSWSDGQVGLWGVSALCGAQYRTAAGPVNNAQHPDFADEPPPHLRAMVPIMCPVRLSYQQYYPGGVLRHEYLSTLDVLGYGLRTIIENNPRKNWLWDLFDAGAPAAKMKVPALVISGWWDLLPAQTVAAFAELVADSDPTVRSQHRLLIGPWIHFAAGGAVNEGAARPLSEEEWLYMDSERLIDTNSLAFFDHHMRGQTNEVPNWAPVRYQHENEGWKTAPAWPPSEAQHSSLYLNDQGVLAETAPIGGSLAISYDPADPSPTLGGPTLAPYNCVNSDNPLLCSLTPDPEKLLIHGPTSQAEVMARDDQLTFLGPVLEQPLALLGSIRLQAEVATDGADMDLALRLVDIDEAGLPLLIGQGIARLSARQDDRNYVEVTPGQRESLSVKMLGDLAYTLPAGHRLGVILSGANWPLFARNPADGAVFMAEDTTDDTNETFSYGSPVSTVQLKGTGQTATHTIFLDGSTFLEFSTPQ